MDFNWFDVDERDQGLDDRDQGLDKRFVGDYAGVDLWEELFRNQFGTEAWAAAAHFLLASNAFESRRRPAKQQETVFISHRQKDTPLARKAAKILRARGVFAWLDVEDPTLSQLSGPQHLHGAVTFLFTALIIEMALINSTHVLALFTNNTKGTMWVPYEYGRIKRDNVFARQAGSLYLSGPPVPDYTLLGTQLWNMSELNNWP